MSHENIRGQKWYQFKCAKQKYSGPAGLFNSLVWIWKKKENVHVYSSCALLCVLLVIYKFLSLGLQSGARSGQAKQKNANPSHRWVKQSRWLMSRGEWGDSVCFERGARMDSFTAVLTTPSRSSMYKLSVLVKKMIPVCNDYSNVMIMWIFYLK